MPTTHNPPTLNIIWQHNSSSSSSISLFRLSNIKTNHKLHTNTHICSHSYWRAIAHICFVYCQNGAVCRCIENRFSLSISTSTTIYYVAWERWRGFGGRGKLEVSSEIILRANSYEYTERIHIHKTLCDDGRFPVSNDVELIAIFGCTAQWAAMMWRHA